ncbi:putative uncharacterized protein [Bacillus sp. CAG:988]|nr:putative uncharacterized protein [Bacillus sp. CAG:988]
MSVVQKITLFVVVALSILFYPYCTYAFDNQSSYSSIQDVQELNAGEVSFSNLVFHDYSTTSTLAFGLTGNAVNHSDHSISYSSTVSYYDASYHLIAQSISYATATVGESSFHQMSNLSILDGHSVSEIAYYQLEVHTSDNLTSEITDPEDSISEEQLLHSHDYTLSKYDVNIIVNENNTFDITETITAHYNTPKHGIIRDIPLKNEIVRLDGTTSKNRAQVTNVRVNHEYTTQRTIGNYRIQIGSPDAFLTGEETYVIQYTYNIGKDPIKGYDELYFNIIGDKWDTVIQNITFSITMPKEFDVAKLGFSSGEKGSTANEKVEYTVKENVITGKYHSFLNSNEALTVRCELPEGYFVGAKLELDFTDYKILLIPVACLGISILLWFLFGRNDPLVEPVEFYPPKGLNSLEVGLLYKGKADNQDVTSLLIYLANKGYLEITDHPTERNFKKVNLDEKAIHRANKKIAELQNKIQQEKNRNPNSKKIKYYENLLNIYQNIDAPVDYERYGVTPTKRASSKNTFYIRKLKDYDGTDENEKMFLDGLFELADEVTEKMLRNRFFLTNFRILLNANRKEKVEKIFVKIPGIINHLIVIMMMITYLVATVPPVFSYLGFDRTIGFLIFSGVILILFMDAYFSRFHQGTKIHQYFGCVFFSLIVFFSFVLPSLQQDISYQIIFFLAILFLIGIGDCLKNLPKRTKYGNEMLGRIKGFRRFLITVEKEKLESLVMEHPNYFYDILPYTYVLGISDKWIRKFESISLEPPSWYGTSSSLDFNSFGTAINLTMGSVQRAMSSAPMDAFEKSSSGSSSDSSSGGSSGGGSSGGGSGGGGGSSW